MKLSCVVNIGSSSGRAGNAPAASCCHADSWEEFLITLQLIDCWGLLFLLHIVGRIFERSASDCFRGCLHQYLPQLYDDLHGWHPVLLLQVAAAAARGDSSTSTLLHYHQLAHPSSCACGYRSHHVVV